MGMKYAKICNKLSVFSIIYQQVSKTMAADNQKQKSEEIKALLNQNPFYHNVHLTKVRLVRTLICGVILIPIRIFLIFMIVCILWLPYCLVLAIMPQEHNITWQERDFVMWFMWVMYKIVGISPTFDGRKIKL